MNLDKQMFPVSFSMLQLSQKLSSLVGTNHYRLRTSMATGLQAKRQQAKDVSSPEPWTLISTAMLYRKDIRQEVQPCLAEAKTRSKAYRLLITYLLGWLVDWLVERLTD